MRDLCRHNKFSKVILSTKCTKRGPNIVFNLKLSLLDATQKSGCGCKLNMRFYRSNTEIITGTIIKSTIINNFLRLSFDNLPDNGPV